MGMNLLNGVPVVFRQTTDAVGDVELVFSHNGGARVAQQLVVVEQRTRYRVLDGEHADGGGVLLDVAKHLFEGGTTYQLYLFSLEIQVRRYIVERPDQSLYRYSLHILKKQLRFHCSVKRSLISIFQSFNFSILLTTTRFTIACKVKVIAVKISVQH
jgi:hypothetical protein